MAEILIRAASNTSGHQMAWQRGMPVTVQPDGHPWSPKERLPPAQGGPFVIVKIPLTTVAQVNAVLRARWALDLCDEEDAMPEFGRKTRRRAVHLRVNDLPPAVRTQLNTTGTYTTTWAAIRTFVQNLRTQENVV